MQYIKYKVCGESSVFQYKFDKPGSSLAVFSTLTHDPATDSH